MFAKGRNVSRRSRRQVSWHEHERPDAPEPESACDGNACNSRETQIGKFSLHEFRCLIVLSLFAHFKIQMHVLCSLLTQVFFSFREEEPELCNVRFLQKPRIYNSSLNQTGDMMGKISCEEVQFSNMKQRVSKRLSLVLSQNLDRLWRTLA
jgi:hypothetical protein